MTSDEREELIYRMAKAVHRNQLERTTRARGIDSDWVPNDPDLLNAEAALNACETFIRNDEWKIIRKNK